MFVAIYKPIFLMMLVTDFSLTLKLKVTLSCFSKKQAFMGGEKSQSPMAGRKQFPVKDSKAQSSSEHKGKRKSEKTPIWFALGCSAA